MEILRDSTHTGMSYENTKHENERPGSSVGSMMTIHSLHTELWSHQIGSSANNSTRTRWWYPAAIQMSSIMEKQTHNRVATDSDGFIGRLPRPIGPAPASTQPGPTPIGARFAQKSHRQPQQQRRFSLFSAPPAPPNPPPFPVPLLTSSTTNRMPLGRPDPKLLHLLDVRIRCKTDTAQSSAKQLGNTAQILFRLNRIPTELMT